MKRKDFFIILSIILAAVIALVWWSFSAADEPEWDVCYPMTNANISWNQTFHGGIWNGK